MQLRVAGAAITVIMLAEMKCRIIGTLRLKPLIEKADRMIQSPAGLIRGS